MVVEPLADDVVRVGNKIGSTTNLGRVEVWVVEVTIGSAVIVTWGVVLMGVMVTGVGAASAQAAKPRVAAKVVRKIAFFIWLEFSNTAGFGEEYSASGQVLFWL